MRLIYAGFALAIALAALTDSAAFGANERNHTGGRFKMDVGGHNVGFVNSTEVRDSGPAQVEQPAAIPRNSSGARPGVARPGAVNGIIVQGGLSPNANAGGNAQSDQKGIIVQGGRPNGAAPAGLGSHHNTVSIGPKPEDPANDASGKNSQTPSDNKQD